MAVVVSIEYRLAPVTGIDVAVLNSMQGSISSCECWECVEMILVAISPALMLCVCIVVH